MGLYVYRQGVTKVWRPARFMHLALTHKLQPWLFAAGPRSALASSFTRTSTGCCSAARSACSAAPPSRCRARSRKQGCLSASQSWGRRGQRRKCWRPRRRLRRRTAGRGACRGRLRRAAAAAAAVREAVTVLPREAGTVCSLYYSSSRCGECCQGCQALMGAQLRATSRSAHQQVGRTHRVQRVSRPVICLRGTTPRSLPRSLEQARPLLDRLLPSRGPQPRTSPRDKRPL